MARSAAPSPRLDACHCARVAPDSMTCSTGAPDRSVTAPPSRPRAEKAVVLRITDGGSRASASATAVRASGSLRLLA